MRDTNREVNAGIALYLPQPSSVAMSWKQCLWALNQSQTEWDHHQFCPRTQSLESNQPRLGCQWGGYCSLESHLIAASVAWSWLSKSVAIYACDSVINRPIYSALLAAVFLQWRNSNIRKRADIAPFSMWSSFLASLTSILTSIWHPLISILSVPLFLNLLRQAAGELALWLVDTVMRQRKKTTELA